MKDEHLLLPLNFPVCSLSLNSHCVQWSSPPDICSHICSWCQPGSPLWNQCKCPVPQPTSQTGDCSLTAYTWTPNHCETWYIFWMTWDMTPEHVIGILHATHNSFNRNSPNRLLGVQMLKGVCPSCNPCWWQPSRKLMRRPCRSAFSRVWSSWNLHDLLKREFGGGSRFNESWAHRHQINDPVFSRRHFRISHLVQNNSQLKAHFKLFLWNRLQDIALLV